MLNVSVGLLRVHQALKFQCYAEIPNLAAGFVGIRLGCVLCGRKNYSTDDSRRQKLIKVLKEGDHEKRYSIHSSRVQSLSEEDLLERFRNLERLNIVNYDSLDALPLLAKHPFTVRNRVELLLECGFKEHMITAVSLAKYLTLVKQTVQTLKKQKFIPAQLDVMSHILQHVDIEPKFYPEEMLDRDATILKLRIAILRAFLKRRFGVTDQELKDRGQNITRLWNKSFSTIYKNIRLIEDGVGMPTQTLRNNLYLLALNPANTETILREVKMVGNLDIYTALKTRPKIICNTCGNLSKILKLLERHKIPCVFNNGALKLLTLSYTTVRQRLEELDTVEYFSLNKGHPRILTLLCEQNSAKKRLKILEEHHLNPASLNTLVTNWDTFERYLTEGHDHSHLDLMYFISNQYGVGFPEIRKLVKKHPFWTTVSLVTVGRNHRFLSQYMPRSEILKCPLVLFYPCDKVQEEFFKLESRENVDCCRGADGKIKLEYIAPLMTYFMEKDVNFTFHGIWSGNESGSEGSDAPHVITIPKEDQQT